MPRKRRGSTPHLPRQRDGQDPPGPGRLPGGKQGDVLTVEFRVAGIAFSASTAGPSSSPTRASRCRSTDDQAETDRLWDAIVGNGGKESDCGWCKDKWGYSWQITPRVLTDAMADPDPVVAKRTFEAMMTMKKIDVATIEAARKGDHAKAAR